jgi:hypothetical protein
MLSERERRALQEIEQRTSDEDPRFAASMQRPLSDRAYRWGHLGYDAIIVIAALSAALCLELSANGAGLAVAALAAVTFHLRTQRFPPQTSRWRSRHRRTNW